MLKIHHQVMKNPSFSHIWNKIKMAINLKIPKVKLIKRKNKKYI